MLPPPAEKGGRGRATALPHQPPPPPRVEGGCVWSNSSCLGTTRQLKSYDILELLNQGLQFLHLLFGAKKKKRKEISFVLKLPSFLFFATASTYSCSEVLESR